MSALHLPVLLEETLTGLRVRPGGLFVDGTLGLAGHAREILRRSAPDGRFFGVDKDSEALALAQAALAEFGDRVRTKHADFRELPEIIGAEPVDGILLDLGMSSLQLDSAERGFSMRADGPLDMRMDRTRGRSAEDVVNRMPERELADVIYRFGEEPASRRVAQAIVFARRQARIQTTVALAEIVRRAVRHSRPGLDPATRTFQALRIHVNGELEELEETLSRLAACLRPGGRLVVISFHSLEDRAAKQAFRSLGRSGYQALTRKPLRPGADEVRRNPRARSARLRVLSRLETEAA